LSEIAFDTLTGVTLGNYHLKRLIEHSQTGPVFLAQSNTGKATYRLRFLDDLDNAREQWRSDDLEQFCDLAKELVALQHPYILPLLDYGIYQGIPYLVTPKRNTRSLRSRLADNEPINAFTVGRYLDQITAALEYAHEHDVFHGNLTLDTIYIRLNGQIVVADFGVRNLLGLNAPGELLSHENAGNAPEQLIDEPIGPYTDVYALGAVLYQLLTDSQVFAGATDEEVVYQHLITAIQPFSQSRNDLSAGLSRIIAQALDKDPRQRYQQAGALANAYHQIVDPNDKNRVPFVIVSSPSAQAQQPIVPETIQAEKQITEREWSTDESTVFDRDNGLPPQASQILLLPILEEDLLEEDFSDDPTLKRVPAILKQTPIPLALEEFLDDPTPRRVPAILKQTPIPPFLEDDLSGDDSLDLASNSLVALPPEFEHKNTSRMGVIALLLLFILGGIAGMMLISKQNAAFSGLTKQITFFNSSEMLLGLCVALAIGFTVSFNIISRMSLSTTRHEHAYTILWQMFCALLAPLFLLFDRFAVSFNPAVLPLFALSIVLWALVDAFLFSAFKYEEASVLSAIFPLNFLFTFVVSVIFFHSVIKSTIVVGFLIVMFASLLVGLYHTRFRPSKGIIFGLLYSFFLGVALGLNSVVVKSFSIAPYMFAAFLFPAITNLYIFLRPKVAELRYELKVQWKKILLNAAVMDASFFFLLKGFQLGNVPQVVALTASSTLLTVLAGVVILKEDKHTALKIIAAVLATVGILLVQR
jgi:serine/threonine protein kinase/drug/metabolite transporter (DMT)-like permease